MDAAAERHSIKSWVARLSAEGEALTLEEAQILALGDVQARLERYLAAMLGVVRGRKL